MRSETDLSDAHWMKIALEEAAQGLDEGEVPVGSVVVLQGEVISRSHNRVIALADPTAHGEILALRQAASQLGNYRVTGAALYVTLEPCLMCAAALIQARVQRLVYGASSPKFGYFSLVPDFFSLPGHNHHVEVRSGVLARECSALLKRFFGPLRDKS